jgi:Tol biopolymer transport system component
MKRPLGILGGLLGVLVLGVLLIALVFTLGELHKETKPASQAYQSPIETPTQPSYPPPQLTSCPTSTRPPEMPTRTPTSTFTPAPPTPTPEPLPTLVPGLQTFLYATTGEKGPEIHRLQLDQMAHVIVSTYRVNTPILWRSRVYIEGFHPSPDGRRVAVSWAYGEGGTFVSLLDIKDGAFSPLFGEQTEMDQRVEFLDWSPNGDQLLVLGGIDNSDLSGRAWLVDAFTGNHMPVDISQVSDARQITSASFSPDGQTIVYAKSDCYQCDSEVWLISLKEQGVKQLLLQNSAFRVEDVLWSPDGRHIALTQWHETVERHEFAAGELWVIDLQGNTRYLVSPVTTGYYKRFTPAWSPDGRNIAFILGEEPRLAKQSSEPSLNVYIADVSTREICRLTHFQDTQVLKPIFSPDGSMVAFVATISGVPEQFEPWLVAADGHGLRRFDERATLILNARSTTPAMAWLSEFLPGGDR